MKGFIKVPTNIFRYDLGTNARKILCYLLGVKKGDNTVVVRASVIAERCGIKSRKTVCRAVRELEALHLITARRRHGKGGYKSANEYRMAGCQAWFKLDKETLEYPNPAFEVALFMSCTVSKKKRVWYSLSKMSRVLKRAKNTILHGLRALQNLGFMQKLGKRPGKHNCYQLACSPRRPEAGEPLQIPGESGAIKNGRPRYKTPIATHMDGTHNYIHILAHCSQFVKMLVTIFAFFVIGWFKKYTTPMLRLNLKTVKEKKNDLYWERDAREAAALRAAGPAAKLEDAAPGNGR